MTLRSRIHKLETQRGGDFSPLVIVFRVDRAKGPVRVSGASVEVTDAPAGFAIIGAGPHGEAANLTLADGEAEAVFLSRVEAETVRIHGRLPIDWNAA